MFKIRRGLDLPISGKPQQVVKGNIAVKSVAVIGPDYPGMKPTMEVVVGDRVKQGQLLFTDKKTGGVRYTAPAAGIVSAIHRGDRRVFQSLVIDLEGDERETYRQYSESQLAGLDRQQVVENLVQSGLWTSLRTRPFSKVPSPETEPRSIFVTAIDTNPLAVDPGIVIQERSQDFVNGLTVLSRLTKGPVYLCTSPDARIVNNELDGVVKHTFAGPHPAGLVGTHIHYIDPVSVNKTVWHINYQDVLAMGYLFTQGVINPERVISIAGPQVAEPCIVKTQIGASIADLTAGLLKDGRNRMISGSVLSGRNARGPFAYLGRYALQVSVIEEGAERKFMRYLSPGADIHSAMPVFLSNLTRGKLFNMTASTNGSERAMVPIGNYEKVMPLDILPTQLLRALIVGDTDTAQKLGCLELDEEDLSLCTYVCVGKYEYGPILRDNLARIEKEG